MGPLAGMMILIYLGLVECLLQMIHFHKSILAVTVAAEYAAARDDVKGPGTFLPALIDELHKLSYEKIAMKAKIQVVQI